MTSSSAPSPRAAKRAKLGDNNEDTKDASTEDWVEKAWEHYLNYMDSCEANEGDGEGDTDELEEMLNEVLKPHMMKDIQPLVSLEDALQGNDDVDVDVTTSSLLPILISVAYYHLTESAIAECLEVEQSKNQSEEKQILIQKCQNLIEQSLHWFPENAAMWSMGANFARVEKLLPPDTICQWYERAVECAVQVRTEALNLLEGDDDNIPPSVKEWTESLLLNHVAGVEYVVDDEEEEDQDEDSESEDKAMDEKKEAENGSKRGAQKKNGAAKTDCENLENSDKENEEEKEGYFSSSAVEATARFMAAMLHSTAGRHDLASENLEHFPVTHRLHPNVWQSETKKSNTLEKEEGTKQPIKYSGTTDGQGVLPPALYKHICQVFAPEAAYWRESDYNHRGYYSYFMDIPTALRKTNKNAIIKHEPNNVIEDVIWNYLYRLIGNRGDICGAEWWVHTRGVSSNLGHNLHFDTDEALLTQEGAVTHPIYSSVLYLTGAAGGGNTIVLNQTPDSTLVADKAWSSPCEDNSCLIFPGEMLHGVLPCSGPSGTDQHHQDANDYKSNLAKMEADKNISDLVHEQWITQNSQEKKDPNHRLTFLVGFWTRPVPDKMKHRKIYGPCGPIPSNDDDQQQHTWVDEISKGYNTKSKSQSQQQELQAAPLPVIKPAWEVLKTSVDDNKDWLQIPKAIDHRFFVCGAPKCFRDSLFERSEEDDVAQEEEEDNC